MGIVTLPCVCRQFSWNIQVALIKFRTYRVRDSESRLGDLRQQEPWIARYTL